RVAARGVALADRDHLAVGGAQPEVRAGLAGGDLVAALEPAVVEHRQDAAERAGAVPVALRPEQELAVAGEEVEVVLAVVGLPQLEVAADADLGGLVGDVERLALAGGAGGGEEGGDGKERSAESAGGDHGVRSPFSCGVGVDVGQSPRL